MIDNEIKLKEFFNLFWAKKFYIIVFTLLVTILSAFYVSLKKPIYEVKSVIKIGHIKGKQLESNEILTEKIKIIFSVSNQSNDFEKEMAIVSKVNAVKNTDDMIEVYTQALSNEEAKKKNNEVLTFIQKTYQEKINEYIFVTNLEIDKLNKNLINTKTIEKENILAQIKKLKDQEIPRVDKNIDVLKTQKVKRIDKEINFLKDVEVRHIDNKLVFNRNKIVEYEENIKKAFITSTNNSTQNLINATQIMSTQNLILTLQNRIEDLDKQKANIINIKIKNLENKRKNLIEIDLKELERKKENLITEKLKKLTWERDIYLKERIESIENQIKLAENKLSQNYVQKSYTLGNLLININSVKPRASLIITVSFIISFILSILILLFIDFLGIIRRVINN